MRRLLAGLVLVAGVALLVVGSGATVAPSVLEGTRTVDVDALADPGCREVEAGDPDDRDHLDPATAPSAEELYGDALPAAGQHFRQWSPVVAGLPDQPQDPRGLLHNMEHGAVVVWIDPAATADRDRDLVSAWRDQLGGAGFDNLETGAAVFTSLVPDHVTDAAPVSLRAWGVALDCDRWDLEVADAFVGLHYGTRGDAPESELGPWPRGNGVLVGPPGADDGVTTTV